MATASGHASSGYPSARKCAECERHDGARRRLVGSSARGVGARRGTGAAPLSAAATFHKPNELRANAEWFHENDKLYKTSFGYWTDIVAVATGELDLNKF